MTPEEAGKRRRAAALQTQKETADPSLPFAPQTRPERKERASLRVNARDDAATDAEGFLDCAT